jgi:hypothetical protein
MNFHLSTYIIHIWNDFIHHLKNSVQIWRYCQYAVKYKCVCENRSFQIHQQTQNQMGLYKNYKEIIKT